jgi:hypothetical protein
MSTIQKPPQSAASTLSPPEELGLVVVPQRCIDGTLTLAFSNQHRLTVLDSSKEYESYDITRPGQTIIV